MIETYRGLSVVAILVVGLCISHAAIDSGEKDKGRVYHGLISEDAVENDEVELDQPLFVRNRNGLTGDDICGYTVYKSHSELPFKVDLTDKRTGTARIVLAPGYSLNYERRYHYSFEIAAHDCATGTHTERERMFIEVVDVNEYPPAWTQETYIAEVYEGRLYDQIVQLETVDQDGSRDLSRVCHYHILTPDVPFRVDDQGFLLNTEMLNYDMKHNYILEVKAEDCGGRQSDSIMVNIQVKPGTLPRVAAPLCTVGWSGIEEAMDYLPGSKQQLVAEHAQLELCGATCPEPQISATLALDVDHMVKSCDRDTSSIKSQRKLCGASAASVDLLPPRARDSTPPASATPSAAPGDQGREADQVFAFDGVSTALEVPATRFDPLLGDEFTLATWLKHEEDAEDDSEHGQKEHVLCYSDGEYHNRHHYSVFVHNCRLVLLVRKEPETGVDLNTFKEAEWRWALPQVCDGQWHHYTINMEFPQVRLFVDGRHFVDEKDNPVIVDDWPLHPSNKVVDHKLVVGACWHGKESRMSQHFKGSLAGLTLLKGTTEQEPVIKCLSDCQEKLDFHAMDEMDTGMSISLNSEMTEITINGDKSASVAHLLQRVSYLNNRLFPTPGHRPLTLTTHVSCGEGTSPLVVVPPVTTLIMVLQAEKPVITIAGTVRISREEVDLKRGALIMRDVTVTSRTQKEQEASELGGDESLYLDASSKHQLDSCTVRVNPPMDLAVERLRYPENLLHLLTSLEVSQNTDGLIITGPEKVYNYQEVLRELHYVHDRSEDINSRHFTVVCTELNGRFVSNEFAVEVSVVHEQHVVAPALAAQSVAKLIQPVKQLSVKDDLTDNVKAPNGIASVAGSGTGVGMIVIIVVCVGFLMFMIVLGVIRIRSSQQRTTEVTVEDKQEMEWDNSALTITVNPMDQEAAYGEHELTGMGRADDSDSDEDDVSVGTHDDLESSEEEAEKVKDRDLEWDDSTLTF